MAKNLEHGTLYYGDCLEWMVEFPAECVDLIYLDPPFNSSANYNVIFGEQKNGVSAQRRAFSDTWRWNQEAVERVQKMRNAIKNPAHSAILSLSDFLGNSGMLSYLSYMAERLVEMKRILKPTGSIYLHCDPTASHYLKLLMDGIFGAGNFRNEIAWCYRGAGYPKNDFGRRHDIILRYSKTDKYVFNVDEVREEYAEATKKRFEHYIGNVRGDKDFGEQKLHEKGKHPDDWWQIQPIAPSAKERTGYPTQKPIAILHRIIAASSNEGDFVLDPFCGCGTTIMAAHELKRKWAGIDISSFAIRVVKDKRLAPNAIASKSEGMPADLSSARQLASEKPLAFETWAIECIAGLVSNDKQVGDSGIDGRGKIAQVKNSQDLVSDSVVAQVKGGKFVLSQLRDFLHVVGRDKVGLGIYITLDKVTSDTAYAEAAEFGKFKIQASTFQRVQLWSIEEYFNGVKPNIPIMLDPYTGEQIGQTVRLSEA